MTRLISVAQLLVLSLLLAGCNNSSDSSGTLFFEGKNLIESGLYGEGITQLETYLDSQPQGKFVSRAHLFLGKGFMAMDLVDAARAQFQILIDRHAGTPEGKKAHYKLAVIDFMEGQVPHARRRLELIASSVKGPLLPEAEFMLKRLSAAGAP